MGREAGKLKCRVLLCLKAQRRGRVGFCGGHYEHYRKGHNPFEITLRERHGKSGTPEHNSWIGMRRRCCDPGNPKWPRYGGRGIKVCERWLKSFPDFLIDMGEKPSPIHSLDRIDNDGNYEPSNCRWATPKEQARDVRVLITCNGQTKSVTEWAALTGISRWVLQHRYHAGWSHADIVTKKVLSSREVAEIALRARWARQRSNTEKLNDNQETRNA